MKTRMLFLFFFTMAVPVTGYMQDSAHLLVRPLNERDSLSANNKVLLSDTAAWTEMLDKAINLDFDPFKSHANKAGNAYFYEALKQALAHNQLADFIAFLDRKGVEARNNANFLKSIRIHEIELNLADSIGNPQQLIKALNNLAVAHRRIDNYARASDYYLRSKSLASEHGLDRSQSIAINGLGNIQFMIGNYDEALEYFREGLQFERADNNLLGMAINLNNIGNVYFNKGDYNKAMEYFMLSLDLNRDITSAKGIAINYHDIGRVYLKKNDPLKALVFMESAIEQHQQAGDMYYLAISYKTIGEVYIALKQYEQALKYLNEGISLARQSYTRATLEQVYRLMHETYKKLNKPWEAMDYLVLAHQTHDSIINEETRRTILQLMASFDNERAQNQITLLQNEKEIADLEIKRQKGYKLVTGLVLALVVIGLIFTIIFSLSKVKTNRILTKKNREIKTVQKELKMYASQLLKAKEQAEESNKMKSRFLANMSHEIRTPMNSVIGFTEILSKLVTDKTQASYLETIRNSSKNLLILINDILDLSKIEAGKMIIDHGPVSLFTLFSSLQDIFKPQIESKQLELITHIDENLPESVRLSEVRLRQTLFNLLGNAIKFTDSGTIQLKATIGSSKPDGRFELRIEVSDTGVGIAEDQQERIFKAFYQTGQEKGQYHGTGLGLAITRRLVEHMNGRIFVSSKPGEGSVFTLVFDDVQAADTAGKQVADQDEKAEQNGSIQGEAEAKESDADMAQAAWKMPDQHIGDYTGLIVNEELRYLWNKALSSHFIHDVESLANAILIWAEQYGIDEAKSFANELLTSCKSFDIESMTDLLNRFPEVYEQAGVAASEARPGKSK